MVNNSPNLNISNKSSLMAGFGVTLASIGFGIVPFFTRSLTDQGLSPQAIAFFRYSITAFILLPALRGQILAWKQILWGIGGGAGMGLGWICYVSAVKVLPISTVGVLYMTYPVFTILISFFLFKEKATRLALLASLMIILAAFIAGNPMAFPSGQLHILIISLLAPISFGFVISILVHRLSDIPPLSRVACISLGATLVLSPLMVTANFTEVMPQDFYVLGLVMGFSIGSAFIPQLIYTIASPIIGTSRTAVLGSVELPTMYAVSVIAFGEILTIPQILACILIVSAMVLAHKNRISPRVG